MLDAPFSGIWELFKIRPPATAFIEVTFAGPDVGTISGDGDKVELIADINIGRVGVGVEGDDPNVVLRVWLLVEVELMQELLTSSKVHEKLFIVARLGGLCTRSGPSPGSFSRGVGDAAGHDPLCRDFD